MYGCIPTTEAERHRREVEQVVYGTSNKADTEKARKTGMLPFGGRFNPYQSQEDRDDNVTPSRGQSQVRQVPKESPSTRLNPVHATVILMAKCKAQGNVWCPSYYSYLVEHYPGGIWEDQLKALMQTLLAQSDGYVIK